MVAKITIPHSVQKTLGYNERKVATGKAVCLGGDNCLSDPQLMTWQKKLEILEHRNLLNDRAITKTLHVSLNFSREETISENKLKSIASFYMDKIGFGEQPFFVYQHFDAGHPHIHIVSTLIRPDGSRIHTHNMGRNQSEIARKETEQYFGLTQIQKKKRDLSKPLPASDMKKANYGKEETRKSIISVLSGIIYQYNYTSLEQLNAVLKLYNITADRGREESVVYNNKGLYYRMLDHGGARIGVSLKAGSLKGKPTLACLEQQFTRNKTNRELFQQDLENTLDRALLMQPKTIPELCAILNEKNIALTLTNHHKSNSLEMTFIDKENKSVFTASELKQVYQIKALSAPLESEENNKRSPALKRRIAEMTNERKEPHHHKGKRVNTNSIVEPLVTPPLQSEPGDGPILSKNNKGKKKGKKL